MTHEPTPEPQRRRHPAVHLIWAMPLAITASAFLSIMSALEWCGLFGCSGGGFGRISDPNITAAVLFLIASGVVAALPLALVRWSPSRSTRWLVAGLVAVFVCSVGYFLIGP